MVSGFWASYTSYKIMILLIFANFLKNPQRDLRNYISKPLKKKGYSKTIIIFNRFQPIFILFTKTVIISKKAFLFKYPFRPRSAYEKTAEHSNSQFKLLKQLADE